MKKVLTILAIVIFVAVGAAVLTAQEAENCAEVAKVQCADLQGDTDAYNECWNKAYEECSQRLLIDK